MMSRRLQNNYMTRNLEPGLEPQAHVRVRMYRYSGATGRVVELFLRFDQENI
jgi:hypothetical protein